MMVRRIAAVDPNPSASQTTSCSAKNDLHHNVLHRPCQPPYVRAVWALQGDFCPTTACLMPLGTLTRLLTRLFAFAARVPEQRRLRHRRGMLCDVWLEPHDPGGVDSDRVPERSEEHLSRAQLRQAVSDDR